MFYADCEQKKFRPTEHNGFDVLDFSVLDIALQDIEKGVQELISSLDLITTIEFARDDYSKAFKHFSRDFLSDAYFLYIDTDLETCLKRIHERVAHPSTADDHPSLSDDAFRIHYQKDNRPYIASRFVHDYLISNSQVVIIDNVGSRQSFIEKINEFVEIIFKQEADALWERRTLVESSVPQRFAPLQAPLLVPVSVP